ncbi:hypothetical protein Ddc_15054 [Ditylenchus destructor]|nr:hypothetical protein Ddc_15054 [Ditylenchus destructor]
MDDDTLLDVFRLLSRKQLSQSVALVCHRFCHLVNSPILPNLHYIIYGTGINPHFKWPLYPARKEWGFVISAAVNFITYEELQTTHRPTKYLRFAHLNIQLEHLAKEKWRKCLWEFRHCFVDCHLMLNMHAQFTALEFQCFLADWILRLFPNCIYFIDDCTFISSTDDKKEQLPTLEALGNFCKSKFLQFGAKDRQAVASSLEPSLLISHPSLFNCSCVKIKAFYSWRYCDRDNRYCDSFVPQKDAIEWLHHVPAESTTLSRKGA